MPPTFSSMYNAQGQSGLSFLEKAEVSYRITAVWQPLDISENRGVCVIICHHLGSDTYRPVYFRLEVPIIFCPDADFQSMDGSKINFGSKCL